MKALTDIRHDDKFFRAGEDVSGLDKDAEKQLVEAGALGSDDDFKAMQSGGGNEQELQALRARIAELESQTEVQVNTGATDPDTKVQDQVNPTDKPGSEKGKG